jgi:hypothetical protein
MVCLADQSARDVSLFPYRQVPLVGAIACDLECRLMSSDRVIGVPHCDKGRYRPRRL